MNFQWDKKFSTSVTSSELWPKLEGDADICLLFFDTNLLGMDSFVDWKSGFKNQIPLKGGEELKNLNSLSRCLEEIASFEISHQKSVKFVVVGGGSLGDFVGFMASIFKRGVKLIQIPSTWLSAIDSAHGGKTAINLLNAKNQIGTFYPASEIYLVKELLLQQPVELAGQALSEYIKMGILDKSVSLEQILSEAKFSTSQVLWSNLLDSVAAKYKIVVEDPFEEKSIRQLLNLGHSFGHILESHHKLSHGESVAHGLLFALNWSAYKHNSSSILDLSHSLKSVFENALNDFSTKKINKAAFYDLALKDKKSTGIKKLNFIFVEALGSCYLESVDLDQFYREAVRQGVVDEE